MKKFFFFVAAALVSLAANAHTVNNPIGTTDGRYIVKYDCAAGQFAAANDMEVDETFVMAFDITGTWLEEYVKAPASAAGGNRAVGMNFWTSYGNVNGDIRRLKQIEGNIWGMTINFAQAKDATADFSKAMMTDSVMYVWGQLFGFEWTADDMGARYWAGPSGATDSFDGATTQAEGADCLFTFAPYTGTKTSSAEFYGDDFDGGMYNYSVMGYAAPCVEITTAMENVEAVKTTEKVMVNGQLVLIHNGVQYTVLGAQK